MAAKTNPTINIVIPIYNEESCIESFDTSLRDVITRIKDVTFIITYCNDGSSDKTAEKLEGISKKYPATEILTLSKNFGKEIAITAGTTESNADAILTLDSDGQHPVELIPEFIRYWQQGTPIVVGIRQQNDDTTAVRSIGSRLFYGLFGSMFDFKIKPGLTDFRIIDREVKEHFVSMTERSRMTRTMIEWLGYPHVYIPFSAKDRIAGHPTYSLKKLVQLALDSTISMSTSPLRISVYVGLFVFILSTLLGIAMAINLLVGDPFHLYITGSAYLVVFILMLVSLLLISQGIIGMYLAHIYRETQNRPLYIIDEKRSHRLSNDT